MATVKQGVDTMSDLAVENYKKSLSKILDRWEAKNDKIGKQLAPILADLAELQANKSPGPDDKKKIAALQKQVDDLQQKADNAAAELRVEMMLIDLPTNADQKELVKLPKWMETVIKAKGIPLGKGVSIAPDVKYDFKKGKLTYVGVTIHFP